MKENQISQEETENKSVTKILTLGSDEYYLEGSLRHHNPTVQTVPSLAYESEAKVRLVVKDRKIPYGIGVDEGCDGDCCDDQCCDDKCCDEHVKDDD